MPEPWAQPPDVCVVCQKDWETHIMFVHGRRAQGRCAKPLELALAVLAWGSEVLEARVPTKERGR